ncbi:MAG TPA: type II secretion system protein [Vicinamibacterales bacterium]|jgi:prepilin-type N-terminal cleavage/methylation domain-containing protein
MEALPRSVPRDAGFTLLEVTVALAVLAGGVFVVAELFLVSANAARLARASGVATALASQKCEQLRALAWGYDVDGQGAQDTTSDISVWPDRPDGGLGLTASPPDALSRDTPGFVDYLDADGGWIGNGASPPFGTGFVRRWSIEPLAESPADTLVLRVLVIACRASGNPCDTAHASQTVRVVAVRARRTA